MKKVKAFTLIEVLIAITLFVLILSFLYETLDINEKSNYHISKKLDTSIKMNQVKKIFFQDLINADLNALIIDKNNQINYILKLKTTNTYHNPFYNYVSYFISREKNLIRLESLYPFDKYKLNDPFFSTAYIDRLDTKIESFKIIKQNGKTLVYIKKKNKKEILFSF